MINGDIVETVLQVKVNKLFKPIGIFTYCNITFKIKTGVCICSPGCCRDDCSLQGAACFTCGGMGTPVYDAATDTTSCDCMAGCYGDDCSSLCPGFPDCCGGVWENLPMIPTLIQLHVTVWKDAMEKNVLYSVQASLTVARE